MFYLNAKMGGESVLEKMGAPSWTNPMTLAVKGVAELFGGPRTRIEQDRWKRLKGYGFEIPKWVEGDKSKKFDVYRKDLPPDYVGYDSQGNWVNNRFAKTRSEADLTGKDLDQTAAMYESFGKVWDAASEDSKKAIGDLALNNNLVREYKGTVDINWDSDTLTRANEILMNDPSVKGFMAKQPKQYVVPEYIPPWERGA
jgi:hypothetical protein